MKITKDNIFPRCPECGRTPPGRPKKPDSFRKMIGRKLSVRKSVSFKSASSSRSRESREQRERPGAGDTGRQQGWALQVA